MYNLTIHSKYDQNVCQPHDDIVMPETIHKFPKTTMVQVANVNSCTRQGASHHFFPTRSPAGLDQVDHLVACILSALDQLLLISYRRSYV